MDGLTELNYPGAGEGSKNIPNLNLVGFAGPLDFLLRLAQEQKIDLARLSIVDIVRQLAAALEQAPGQLPLGQKADWVVMASWILLLRSNLLAPAAAQRVEQGGGALRDRLLALQQVQALASWLDRRDVLGRDVFALAQPEWAETAHVGYRQKVDVIAFLWAAMDLFDSPVEQINSDSPYHPVPAPYSIRQAEARIARLLAAATEQLTLAQLLPEEARSKTMPSRRRAAWSTTFAASLELAKQGQAILTQQAFMAPIHVRRGPQIDGAVNTENSTIAR